MDGPTVVETRKNPTSGLNLLLSLSLIACAVDEESNDLKLIHFSSSLVVIVALALSILLGLSANAALITRFMERRVLASTLAAIGCLIAHGKLFCHPVLLVQLVAYVDYL